MRLGWSPVVDSLWNYESCKVCASGSSTTAPTLHEAVTGRADEVGALVSDAVPGPLEELNDHILAAGRGPFMKRLRALVEDGRAGFDGDAAEEPERSDYRELDPDRHRCRDESQSNNKEGETGV